MIVPMKKVSLIILGSEKEVTLKKLRKLGLMHIEITEGTGMKLAKLKEQISLIESSIFAAGEKANKKVESKEVGFDEAVKTAEKIAALSDEKKNCLAEKTGYIAELERLKSWGEIDPDDIKALSDKGLKVLLYEMPVNEYEKLEDLNVVVFEKTKTIVRFLIVKKDESLDFLNAYKVELPKISTEDIKKNIVDLEEKIKAIDEEISSFACFTISMKNAVEKLKKEVEFETYATGMVDETISEKALSVSYFKGYIEAENLDKLKAEAEKNAWGIVAEDPTEEDNVPTKLKNNKFVSLIYPLTDFLGMVPGYYEYDISGWFLGFILVFFGIIFGDGGYGLLICAVAGILMLKDKEAKPAYLLIMLFGLSTIIWGILTCSWFGISPEALPEILRKLSLPIISNVNADRIWYPPWTNGEAGLTTAQNVQLICFSLALVQLVAAHVKGIIRNRKSLKLLGDAGSILQLVGMFYVVLAVVVNGVVFPLGGKINGIPVGMGAIALVAVGFIISFIFANYEGSIVKSTLESFKNIISVLLGVVNIFSDIVSYIRLWAVGLAGAAISSTVNELAGPFFGDLAFIALAIGLLVFGHGLNIILNLLSFIVHGVRLNTLEFSTHLDMSWSGHKFEPFEE